MKKLIAVMLALMLLPQILLSGYAAVRTGLEGKTLSILGDSISTYSGVSNNGSRNYTIGRNLVFYTPGLMDVYQRDTWWQQTVDTLGLRLLVNNSWSGSCMFMTGAGTPGAYQERCVQLHSGKGARPDIIAVYLGTNDQDYFSDSLGTFDAIDFEKLILPVEKGFAYSTPETCMEAYAIALHKMQQRYPEAEIYCFTLLQRPKRTPFDLLSFNAELEKLAEHYGVYIVDLQRCGVYAVKPAYDLLMADYVHPNPWGMDAITGAFADALLTNSRYVSEDVRLYTAEYTLDRVAVMQGTARTLVAGNPFRIDLAALDEGTELSVAVTMGGRDITAEVWQNGTISIGEVTGDVQITAAALPER